METDKSFKKKKKKSFEELYEFDMTSEYVKFGDMEQDTYYQFPKWLMKPKYANLDSDCKLLYMIIFDKCKLSYSNFKTGSYTGSYEHWDYTNNVPMAKISNKEFMSQIAIRTTDTLKAKLDLLVELNLIERKRNYDNSTHFKIKKYIEEYEMVYISNKNFDRDLAIDKIKEMQKRKKADTGNIDLDS